MFVQTGGSLTVNGSATLTGNTVSAASGGAQAGSDFYLMTGTSTTLAPGTNNTITSNGTISDTGSSGAALVIGSSGNSGGTVIFNNTNAYTGGTTVGNSTTLQLGNGGSTSGTLGSGQVTDNSALVFDEGVATTIGNSIIGNGSLIQEGTGTLTLTGANSYSGNTTLQTGTLVIGNNTALGTGTLTTIDPTVVYLNGINMATPIIMMGDTTLEVDNTDSATQSGSISESGGSYSVTKTGTGTLFLTGSDTYTGTTAVSAGTLNLEQSGGFNAINQTDFTVSSGATMGLFGYIDQNGTTISGAGSNVSTLKGFSVTTSGNGSDTPLFIYNPANETASGAVASPTAYAVSVSGLLITNGLSQGGNANFGGGGAGLGGGAFVGAGATLTLSNVNVTGNAAVGGSTGLNGLSNIHGGGGIGGGSSSNNGGGLFVNNADGGAGGFGGGGGYNSGGTGFTGGFGGGGGYGNSGGNGGFGGGGGGRSSGGQGFGGVGGGQGSPFINAYGGGGAGLGGGLFVQNGGSVIVTGNSIISGNTVTAGHGADGGGNGAAAGADIFMMAGGTVTLAPGTGNTVTIGAGADDANGVVSDVADDSAYSLGGSGAGAVLTIGNSLTPDGTVILHGNNTYAGGTSITNGATLEVFQDDNLGAFDLTNLAVGGVTLTGGELLTETDGFSTARDITLDAGTNTLAAVTGTTATYNGLVSGEALTVGDAGNAGTVILSDANTYSGGTMISSGTLEAENNSALGTGAATVSSGATLALLNGITIANNITISGTGSSGQGAIYAVTGTSFVVTETVAGSVTLAANSTVGADNLESGLTLEAVDLQSFTLTTNGTGRVNLDGNITGGGGLTIGSQVFAIGGQNSFTGLTDVLSNGDLNLDDSSGIVVGNLTIENGAAVFDDVGGQLAQTTTVTLNGSGELSLTGGGPETIAGLQSTSTTSLVALQSPFPSITPTDLTLDGTGTYAYAGQITDSLGATLILVKEGTGTQTLSGANTYSGGTSLSNGTLIVGNSAALGAGAVNQSGGTLETDDVVNHVITMGSGFSQTGGTLLLNLNGIPGAASNDKVNVTGTAALGGSLIINYAAGALAPLQSETYTVITTTGGIPPASIRRGMNLRHCRPERCGSSSPGRSSATTLTSRSWGNKPPSPAWWARI